MDFLTPRAVNCRTAEQLIHQNVPKSFFTGEVGTSILLLEI